MKRNYEEGTWFAVPLRSGGYGFGLVARAKNGCILAYFFGPRQKSLERLKQLALLNAKSAITVLRIGDLGLIRGEWPIIGKLPSWNRSDWPMPAFIRREPLPPFKNWRVYYADDDPTKVVREELESNDRCELLPAVLSGSGAAEIKLTQLLEENS
jgi:hypothetical protein